jgi:hypothetical protein
MNEERAWFLIFSIPILLVAIALITFLSKPGNIHKKVNYTPKYNVIVIDSCEYIAIGGTHPTITHKGNCKHCSKKYLK